MHGFYPVSRLLLRAFLLSTLALVVFAPPTAAQELFYSDRVHATIVPTATDFNYSFELFNLTVGEGVFDITNLWFPLFDESDVFEVRSPQGWAYEIIAPDAETAYYNHESAFYGFYRWDYSPANDPTLVTDPDAYPVPEVFIDPPLIIHWYAVPNTDGTPLRPVHKGNSLTGFGFRSEYGGTAAPYMAGWDHLDPTIGDPPLPGTRLNIVLPNSPAYQAAIPEPATVFAFLAASGAAILRRRR